MPVSAIVESLAGANIDDIMQWFNALARTCAGRY